MQPLVNKKVYKKELKGYVIEPTPWKWSYSKLEQIISCPYKFYREHVLLDVVAGTNNAFAIGSGIHDGLEQITLDNVRSRLNTPDYYVDVYRESCFNNPDLADKAEVDKYNWMIPNYLEKKRDRIPIPLKRDAPVNCKQLGQWVKNEYWTEFFGTLTYKDTVYGGIIEVTTKGDVLTEKYQNLDWKSGSGAYKKEQLSNPFTPKALQLSLYTDWSFQHFAILADAAWILLRKDTKQIHTYSINITEEILAKLAEVVNYYNHLFIQWLNQSYDDPGAFPRYGTGLRNCDTCRWCDYSMFCR